MGYYVGVQFSFSVVDDKGLVECAQSALGKIDREEAIYTESMLQEIISEPSKCIFYGNKGDMFMWGGVWNYYSPDAEIEALKLFLVDCWNYIGEDRDGVLINFDRALLIVNREQSEISEVYEFSTDWEGRYEEESPLELKEVIIRNKNIDLSWNQY